MEPPKIAALITAANVKKTCRLSEREISDRLHEDMKEQKKYFAVNENIKVDVSKMQEGGVFSRAESRPLVGVLKEREGVSKPERERERDMQVKRKG